MGDKIKKAFLISLNLALILFVFWIVIGSLVNSYFGLYQFNDASYGIYSILAIRYFLGLWIGILFVVAIGLFFWNEGWWAGYDFFNSFSITPKSWIIFSLVLLKQIIGFALYPYANLLESLLLFVFGANIIFRYLEPKVKKRKKKKGK